MKKVMAVILMLLLLSGCGMNNTLTCTRTNTLSGLTSKQTYTIEYKNNDVKKVMVTYDYTNGNTDTTTDGVGTGTDGTTSDDELTRDGIVDGVVGNALDDVISGVTNTILDLAGIKTTHTNRITTYGNVQGFTGTVNTDINNNYNVTYNFDLEKMDDSDLGRFNLNRDLTTLRNNYTTQGLTCE